MGILQNISTKRQLHHVTPIARLSNAMKGFGKNETDNETQIPLQMLQSLNDFMNQEVFMFFTALKINGTLSYFNFKCRKIDTIVNISSQVGLQMHIPWKQMNGDVVGESK